jgi:ATP-dependent DNA ligase
VLRAHQFPLQVVKRIRAPFDGDDWLFEIKHDGFRTLAIRDGGPPRLFTWNRDDSGGTLAPDRDAGSSGPG